jgi:hypothetical protein
MLRLFVIYGILVLGLLGYAGFRGLSLSSYDEVKNVPRSIRNNPGAYRSIYQRYYHK